MSLDNVSAWDASTAANNVDVGGINIQGSASISNGDNALREMMKQLASYTRRGSDLASAGTLNLDSIDSLFLNVTGTTTVTAVTLTSGHWRIVRATGAFQMTAGASLIVNGSTSVNYTTAAEDLLLFEGYGSSVVWVWLIGTIPAASDTLAGKIEIAVQSEMETASSTTLAVTPGRQHFHPGMAKAWGYITVSGGTPTLAASYNVTSIADTATGVVTVTLTTSFSSSNYVIIPGARNNVSVEEATYFSITNGSTFTISHSNGSGSLGEPVSYSFVCFGDQ